MPNTAFAYVLRLADSPLILGQRLSEWCGHGPILEEDLALTNVALDLIGQARLLLAHAGALEGAGRDEDQLAFLRTESDYRNFTLVELPNGDFAETVMRNLLFNAYQLHLWEALRQSSDHELAAIAAKSVKETRYHLRHAADWTVRLGDGTEESHARAQSALDRLWPYTLELFASDAVDETAAAERLRRRRRIPRTTLGGYGPAGPGGSHAARSGTNAVSFPGQARRAQRAHGAPAERDAAYAAHLSWFPVVRQRC